METVAHGGVKSEAGKAVSRNDALRPGRRSSAVKHLSALLSEIEKYL
jgi:hypothetical protein